MACNNEWDTLKEVIVGSADNAKIPVLTESFKACVYPTEKAESLFSKKFPKWIVEEQNEDLEKLSQTLQDLGVKVHRPNTDVNDELHWHHHCPRDLTLIVGNKIIECPTPIENRRNEWSGYKKIFDSLKGYNRIKAPLPSFTKENYQTDDITRKPTLLNNEPMFEAANCLRCNNDILFQISNTGNQLGAEWLQQQLGNNYTVHILKDLYSYAHLDSTIIPLREGLVLFNGSRVPRDNYPSLFKNWDKIWIDKCVTSQKRHEFPWAASEFIGLNLLSVSPNLVIVDEKQKQLIKKLKDNKIECIPLKLRHDRLISGGFHCVTLDLKRTS